MKHFSRVCQQLESVPFNRDKSRLLADYLACVPEREASWALYLLVGGKLPRLIEPRDLQRWILERTGVPEWLFERCQEQAADLAETVALMGQLGGGGTEGSATLTEWIEDRLPALARVAAPERRRVVQGWWQELGLDESWAVHAMALGHFPVRVPRRTVDEALDAALGKAASAELGDRLAALSLAGFRDGGVAAQLDLFGVR